MGKPIPDSPTHGDPDARLTVGGMPVKGGCAVSSSPFVGKLETWMRFAGIEYQAWPRLKLGPKGKVPWIRQGDLYFGDSTFIIQYLRNTYKGKLKLNEEMTPMQEAISVACTRICEDHLVFGLAYYRFLDEKGFSSAKPYLKAIVPKRFRLIAPRMFRKRARQLVMDQGIGRHSKNDVEKLLMADLRALSGFLGDKGYISGDEPTEGDAIVFATLDNYLNDNRELQPAKMVMQFPNLVRYVDSIRSVYFPPENPSKFQLKE